MRHRTDRYVSETPRPVLAALLGVAILSMLPAEAHPRRTLLYFVRHGEQQVRLVRTNAGVTEPGTFVEDALRRVRAA